MTKREVPLFEQTLFRAVVVGGTGLTLAVMLGSLALVQGRDSFGFRFGWSWWAVVFAIAGAGFNLNFWNAIWRVQQEPTHANKSKVVYRLYVLAMLGLGCFLYPIRFLDQANYLSIARGLFTAAIFLGGVGVLLYRIGQGLLANELKDGQARRGSPLNDHDPSDSTVPVAGATENSTPAGNLATLCRGVEA